MRNKMWVFEATNGLTYKNQELEKLSESERLQAFQKWTCEQKLQGTFVQIPEDEWAWMDEDEARAFNELMRK